VAGTDVGEAVGKGAAAGGALGAATSIAGSQFEDASGNIQRDFSSRSIEHSTVAPGQSAHGLLYFPSEAAAPVKMTINYLAGNAARTAELAF
jgi:hypothetical protein